jgi:hypothetical protein
MEKQTAVEFIVKELIKLGYLHSNDYGQSPNVTKVIEQAKEMEKQQMWNYIESNYVNGENSLAFHKSEFEQYYNETYNK